MTVVLAEPIGFVDLSLDLDDRAMPLRDDRYGAGTTASKRTLRADALDELARANGWSARIVGLTRGCAGNLPAEMDVTLTAQAVTLVSRRLSMVGAGQVMAAVIATNGFGQAS